MRKNTLPRLAAGGWSHPYTGPTSLAVFYNDGGDGAGSGSGSSGGGDGGQGGSGDGGAAGGQGQGQPGGQSGGNQGAGQGGSGDNAQDIKSLPAWAQRVIEDARAEAGKARTVAKQNAAAEARQQLAQDIGKALGLVEGDKAPTPEELTEQLRQSRGELTTAQEQAVAAAIELQVYRTALRLGANADRLLDSRAFAEAIDNLDVDPTDTAAFTAAIEKKIREALGGDPTLRVPTGGGRSGADLGGGSGEGKKERPTSLSAAVRGTFNT